MKTVFLSNDERLTFILKKFRESLDYYGTQGFWDKGANYTMPDYDDIVEDLASLADSGEDEKIVAILRGLEAVDLGVDLGTSILHDLDEKYGHDLFHWFEP